jgi:hypothetical protein
MVLVIVAALVGVLAVRGATDDLRMSGTQRVARTSFYCAEAGLAAARPILATQIGQWNTIFSGGTPTGFTYPVVGDLDGDGLNDYSVTIRDNYDEFPPLANNPNVDNDLTAIIVSTCISSTLSTGQHQIEQIVTYTGSGGSDYRYQAGHSSTHSGNEN